MKDVISDFIYKILIESQEPLATKEIVERIQEYFGNVSRAKVLTRLNDLRGAGVIAGKFVGYGNGLWIWWKKWPSGEV
jgi:DNA-directed RNA polymerase delta subunit